MITPTEPRSLDERRATAQQVHERIATGRHLPHATAVLRVLRMRAAGLPPTPAERKVGP